MKTPLIYFSIFAFLLISCNRYYYVPAAQNIPIFREKNEYRANVSLGGADEVRTFDIQAAYSITDHIAVTANYMNAFGGNDSTNEYGKGNYYSMALGYFLPIDKNAVFETYAGYGYSNQHHSYNYTGIYWSDLSFHKYFIQPSIGINYKWLDIAFSSSFSLVHFDKVNFNYGNSDIFFNQLVQIAQNRNSFLWEPSFTFRGGWKYVKIQVQSIATYNFSHPDMAFEKSAGNIGLSFAYAKRFHDKSMKRKNTIHEVPTH